MIKLSAFVLSLSILAAAPVFADGAPPGPADPKPIADAKDAIKKNDFAAAEAALASYVEQEPKDAEGWNLLGFSVRKQGRMDEAEKHYAMALSIDKEHTGALEYQGILYLQTGRIEEARANLAKLDDICFFGCSEYDSLKKAIETGKGY